VSSQEWLHREPKKDGLPTLSKWLQKQVVYHMEIEEVKARTKKKKEESVRSKKPMKATFHNATTKLIPKCVLCDGPHQITLARNGAKLQ